MHISSLKRIFFYLKPHIVQHKVAFFLTFFGYGLGVFLDAAIKPYIYKKIVDVVTVVGATSVAWDQIVHYLLLLTGVIVAYIIAFRTGDFSVSYFESKVMKELYDTSLERVLAHSHGFFADRFSGGIIAKIKRLSRSFEVLTDVVSFQLWFSFVGITSVVVILFFQSALLGSIFLAWSLLYVAVTLVFIRYKIALDLREAEADSRVTARLSDTISNVLNVKIFAQHKQEIESFRETTYDEEVRRMKSWNFSNYQNLAQGMMMAILQIVGLYVTLNLWYEGKVTAGTLVLVQAYMFGIFDVLWSLGKAMTKAVKSLSDMKEVVDIFDTPLEIVDPVYPEISRMNEGSISLRNVSFTYIQGVQVFENFNLDILPRTKIGLVGHSGAGKSTITKLLLRFADVGEGVICIDDQDIRSVTQDDLRNAISYVPQEPILFHRTIRENIAYSNPTATFDNIQTAAKRAQAHEFIINLPKGYDTLVGERGVKLSGGERQRVAIARAMLKSAPILLLDEATSSLDSVSETFIQQALDELMKDKTVIVIAHRLSTIQKMDRIIVLDEGAIVEDGTHAELLAKKGIYHELWSHQSAGFIAE